MSVTFAKNVISSFFYNIVILWICSCHFIRWPFSILKPIPKYISLCPKNISLTMETSRTLMNSWDNQIYLKKYLRDRIVKEAPLFLQIARRCATAIHSPAILIVTTAAVAKLEKWRSPFSFSSHFKRQKVGPTVPSHASTLPSRPVRFSEKLWPRISLIRLWEKNVSLTGTKRC